MNTKYLQTEVGKITIELLNEVITDVFNEGHNSHAPLGCSGDTYILYGTSRRMEISLRLHSGDVKMLITDNIGAFIFYGGYDTSLLPISFIAQQYLSIIKNVEFLLVNTRKSKSITKKDREEMFKSKSILKNTRH